MLSSFLAISAISVSVIALNALIAYEIMRGVWLWLPRLTLAPRLRVLALMVPIFLIHIIGIWIYALVYFLVENFTGLGALQGMGHTVEVNYQTFTDCLYFSAATYSSLGFGDLLPTGDLRMLSSSEVLAGLVMIGWTVSLTYLSMEKFWTLPHGKKRD